ncbi:MAG: ABC transporter ATP-binding protein, partial [Eubacterium sp.]|nr:ABC transporter ATP-binding protein [Eubacterium sp.]
MFKYLKKYILFACLSPIFMFGEVAMDLVQPALMKTIVDEGVLGVSSGGVGSLELGIVTGLKM